MKKTMPKMYPGYREEVRKKIVAEASSVFMAKGYSAATMDDIASRLGVTKAAIYQYYAGKPDLFAAVAEYQRQQLAGLLDRSFSEPDLMTGAAAVFDNLLEYINRSRTMYADVMLAATRNESLRKILNEDRNGDLAVISGFIDRQKERGLIHSSIDSRVLAIACDALINGLMYDVMIGMDPGEAKMVWLDAVDDLLRVHPHR
jgi:AcrR family transcriptional regulator